MKSITDNKTMLTAVTGGYQFGVGARVYYPDFPPIRPVLPPTEPIYFLR